MGFAKLFLSQPLWQQGTEYGWARQPCCTGITPAKRQEASGRAVWGKAWPMVKELMEEVYDILPKPSSWNRGFLSEAQMLPNV